MYNIVMEHMQAFICTYILSLYVPSRSLILLEKSEDENLPSMINQGTFLFLS